jgi:hypothetical protein
LNIQDERQSQIALPFRLISLIIVCYLRLFSKIQFQRVQEGFRRLRNDKNNRQSLQRFDPKCLKKMSENMKCASSRRLSGSDSSSGRTLHRCTSSRCSRNGTSPTTALLDCSGASAVIAAVIAVLNRLPDAPTHVMNLPFGAFAPKVIGFPLPWGKPLIKLGIL